MKKSLTFLAIVLVAVVSQAATLTWKSGTFYLKNGAKAGATGAPAVTAYFILTDAANVASFNADNYIADNVDPSSGFKGSYDKTVTANALGANWSNQGNYNAGDSQGMIMLFTYQLDGQYYAYATAATGTIGADGKSGNVNNMASAIGTASAAQSAGWTAVPEPTAIALIALGLAAFGLKRKIA